METLAYRDVCGMPCKIFVFITMEVYIDLYTEQARNEIGTPIYLLAAGIMPK